MFAKNESAWFGGTVTVRRDGRTVDLLGVELDDSVLARLAGAFSGSVLEAKVRPKEELRLYVTHRDWVQETRTNVVSLGLRGGDLVLELESINLTESAPCGLAPVMLWRMVRVCQELGVNYITLLAAGGRLVRLDQGKPRYWGYYAWPRFGFNFSLRSDAEYVSAVTFLEAEFPYYPAGITQCQDLLSLMSLPGGDKLWCVGGFQATMDFDLAPASLSIQTLTNYLKQKGFL